MTHIVPQDSYETTLTVIKLEGGVEIERISVKSTAAVTVPQFGSYYELQDNVDGKAITGIVTKVLHKNGISGGPVFSGSVEVILE